MYLFYFILYIFFCLIKVSSTFDKQLNSGESKNLLPYSQHQGQTILYFVIKHDSIVNFYRFLYQVQGVLFLVIWKFYHELMLILFKCFSRIYKYERHAFPIYSVNALNHIDCFLNVNLTFLGYSPLGHDVVSYMCFTC